MKRIELAIPKPCHEDWNAMTPQDRGRFCAACQKTVIDFSTMSDRQVADFFKKPKGSVCGHFSHSQLNRVIDVPKKRIPWVRYFFTIALPAFLFSLKAGAQGAVMVRGRVAVKAEPGKKEPCEKKMEVVEETKILKGKVIGYDGSPIPSATVRIEGTAGGASTNNEGAFQLKWEVGKDAYLRVSTVGYEAATVSINEFKKDEELTIQLTPRLSGEVIVTTVRKKAKPIPLIEPKKTDTAFSKFTVYPNPVSAGNTITIVPKKIEVGNYSVQIISSNGNVLQTTAVLIDKNTQRLSVNLTQMAAGPYFIRLTHRKNNKSFTEIIVVH